MGGTGEGCSDTFSKLLFIQKPFKSPFEDVRARPPATASTCTYMSTSLHDRFRARLDIIDIYIVIFCILAAGRRRLIIDPSPTSIKVMFAFATCQPDIINPDVWMYPLKGKKTWKPKGSRRRSLLFYYHYYYIVIIENIRFIFFFTWQLYFCSNGSNVRTIYSSFISFSSSVTTIIIIWTSKYNRLK